MKAKISVLSDSEKELIHQSTLQILQEVGVIFKSEKALKILQKNGASIDWDNKIAKFPPVMVEEALKRAPKSFVLGARNPKYDFPLPSTWTGYFLDGGCTHTVDFETGEKRLSTSQDAIDATRIFQEMDLGVISWGGCTANDIPIHIQGIYENFALMKYSSKHLQIEVESEEEVEYVMAGINAVFGNEEMYKDKVMVSAVYCPVSPLVHEESMCNAYLELARHGVAIMPYPMPIAGLTSPASLFSTVFQTNAEVLSSIVLFEFAHPGTPIIYGATPATADFASGLYVDKVEANIMSLANGEMAKYYGLPNCVNGGGSVQNSILQTCGEIDLIDGTGTTEGALTLVFEDIVLGNEAAHLSRRCYEGINSDYNFIEDICKVGPGGHFIKQKNTRKMSRNRAEFYVSDVIPDEIRDTLEENEKSREKARKRIQEILNGPITDKLPDHIKQELDEILKCAEAELED